jgi:hypothetical protein
MIRKSQSISKIRIVGERIHHVIVSEIFAMIPIELRMHINADNPQLQSSTKRFLLIISLDEASHADRLDS